MVIISLIQIKKIQEILRASVNATPINKTKTKAKIKTTNEIMMLRLKEWNRNEFAVNASPWKIIQKVKILNISSGFRVT